MPRIEKYTRGIVRQRATPQLVNEAAAASAGSTAAMIADLADKGAQLTDKIALAREKVEVNESIIRAKKEKLELLTEQRQQNMSSPEEFAKRVEPVLQDYDARIEAALSSSRARQAYRNDADDYNYRAYVDNFQWQTNRGVEMVAERQEAAALELGNLAQMAGRSGGDLSEIRQDALDTVITGTNITGVTPEAITQQKRATLGTVERNYALGLMNSEDPAQSIDFLNDLERSSNISGADRSGLITMAENMEIARKNKIKERELKDMSVAAVQEGDYWSRARSQSEDPEALIFEIRSNMAIDDDVKTDLVQIINARKAMTKADKPTEPQKDDFFIGVSDRLLSLASIKEDKGYGEEFLSQYSSLERDVSDGVSKGMISATKADSIMKRVRADLSQAISEDKIGKMGWSSLGPGIAVPENIAIKRIKRDFPNQPSTQRAILGVFTEIVGKVDDNGGIDASLEYKSTFNSARDKVVINRALQRAIELYNSDINTSGANGTVLAVPEIGAVVDGYRFKGGDPADGRNWEAVE